jgi:hypothetical protein
LGNLKKKLESSLLSNGHHSIKNSFFFFRKRWMVLHCTLRRLGITESYLVQNVFYTSGVIILLPIGGNAFELRRLSTVSWRFIKAPSVALQTSHSARQFLFRAGRDSENCYAVQPLTELLQQTAAQRKSNRTEADNTRPQFNATVKYSKLN